MENTASTIRQELKSVADEAGFLIRQVSVGRLRYRDVSNEMKYLRDLHQDLLRRFQKLSVEPDSPQKPAE